MYKAYNFSVPGLYIESAINFSGNNFQVWILFWTWNMNWIFYHKYFSQHNLTKVLRFSKKISWNILVKYFIANMCYTGLEFLNNINIHSYIKHTNISKMSDFASKDKTQMWFYWSVIGSRICNRTGILLVILWLFSLKLFGETQSHNALLVCKHFATN